MRMGCYDGAEVCELVGTLALAKLSEVYNGSDIGLYRDDGLAVFRNVSGPEVDRIRKDMTKVFNNLGLKSTIQANLKSVDFLDITLDLRTGKYRPYRKPNGRPLYVHHKSNHPPIIIQNLPSSISRRLTDISTDEETFQDASQMYNNALRDSGYNETVQFLEERKSGKRKRQRKRRRNITWFNPPFSKNVSTNIGQRFLQLVSKHFHKGCKLYKIFNRNTLKFSYSCMPNVATIIKQHNNSILRSDHQNKTKDVRTCNCRVKNDCPLEGNCLASSVVYRAHVTGSDMKEYTGLTEGTFKTRFNGHQHTIRHKKHETSTRLSRHIWRLKDQNKPYSIRWSVVRRAAPYSNISKRCNLCLAEKLEIAWADKTRSLNKRSELVSKCRH